MVRKPGLVYLNIGVFVFLFAFACSGGFFGKKNIQQVNQPPVVKIVNPKNNSFFDWDTPVNYEITVADKEDGDSKYDEINAKEVLLEVRYAAGKTRVQAILNQDVQNDAPGLAVIRSSNCFNCHNFNSKAIGPAFYDICKRYPASKSDIDSLVKHIRNGSSGIWVKEKMPSHPELSAEETKNAVEWILKNASNPEVNYYIGLEGSIRIKPPAASVKKGTFVLTASYTDHGLKGTPAKRLKGQDVVVLYGK